MARIVVTCLLATIASVLPLFLTSALGVQLKADLGLTNSGFGAVITTHHVAGVVLGVALGRHIDRIGWSRAVSASAVAAAGSLLGIALLARSGLVLALCLVVGGGAHAAAMAGVNLAIVEEVPRRRHAVAFGLKQAAPTAGFLVAGLSLPWVALALGWRWAYVLGAGLAATAGSFVPQVDRSRRRPTSEPASPSPVGALVRPPLAPATARMAWAGGFAATSVSALAAFLVVANVAAGLSPADAGMLAAVCSVAGIAIRVGLGVAIDRTRSNGLRPAAILLFTGCVGYACLASGQRSLVVAGSLVAFAAGWGWPGLYHFAVVSMNPGAPAAATGVTHAAVSAGSAVGPAAFGVLAERVSYSAAWSMVGCAALAGGGLILAARRTLVASPRPDEDRRLRAV